MGEPKNSEFMLLAIREASRGYPAPNPLVGCVVVSKGVVVGKGHHRMAGEDHAEVMALKAAGDEAKGADLYVTLEPCAHHGRTPPCADAIVAAGVKRVFVAMTDPGPGRGGVERLRAAGLEVHVGLCESQAMDLNRIWLWGLEHDRAWVTIKAAITLDGFIAREDGTSKWITSEVAREEARRLRAVHGAVLVGRGTVDADDPALTVRDVPMKEPPIRIVLDPQRRARNDAQLFSDGLAPTWRCVRPEFAQPGDVEFRSLEELLQQIKQAGMPGVLVEGGAATYREFLSQGLVNWITLFVGPKFFGAGKNWMDGQTLPPGFELREEFSTPLIPVNRLDYRVVRS